MRPARLDGQKFVAFEKGLVIRREVDRFLRDHGVEVEVVLEFDNIENIKKGIEIGAGIGLLPEPTLRREVGRRHAAGGAAGGGANFGCGRWASFTAGRRAGLGHARLHRVCCGGPAPRTATGTPTASRRTPIK